MAVVCAVVLAMASTLSTAFVTAADKVFSQVKLLAGALADLSGPDSYGLVMGGTGNPGPDPVYFGAMVNNYLDQLFPGMPSTSPTNPVPGWHGFETPEQFCPITACPAGGLTFGDSVNVGATSVENSINSNLGSLDAPNGIVISGYSQSGTVATVALNDLLANAGTSGYPSADQLANLHYEITGDPNSPIGGILDRFQFPDSITGGMQHVPFVNIPLGIAPTPTSDVGASTIITGEYDGWANFPQDPVTGLLADLNALIGIDTVHPYYPGYSGELGVADSGQLASAVDVGTIGNTTFEFIPENLPILQFMYGGSTTAGQFFGDAFSPWLRLFIDWSYGNAGDPGDNLTATIGGNNAGGSGVDGLFAISPDQVTNGANIAGSPYQASVGVAGGPWAATPYGDLWAGSDPTNAGDVASSGIAGIFEKMDPLQLIAGVQNALIQSIVGPWADVAAGDSATLDPGTLEVVNDITQALRFITGYDLVNGLDQLLLTGAQDLGLESVVNDLFDGPLIPGQPLIDLVGWGFDVFNVFGA